MMSNSKDHIIEVASGLINLRGFNNTSVDAVLQASGVKKGSFYYYFKSKEDLGYAIIESHLRRFSDHVLGKAFSGTKDALMELEDFLDIILELHRQRNCSGGCLMGNMAMEMSDIHEGFRRKFEEVFEDWRIRVAGVLQKAKIFGTPHEYMDSTRLPPFIISGVEGGILLSKVKKDIKVLENCFKELKTHIRLYVTHT